MLSEGKVSVHLTTGLQFVEHGYAKVLRIL